MCHPQTRRLGHGARCCDNGRVGETSVERATGLRGLRRYTWWSLTGTTAFFLVYVIGAWILNPGVPGWAKAASTVLLAERAG